MHTKNFPKLLIVMLRCFKLYKIQ